MRANTGREGRLELSGVLASAGSTAGAPDRVGGDGLTVRDWINQMENKFHTCRRCYCKEFIPTHQFVKFDLRVHYLCKRCWEDYRSWFYWGQRPAPVEREKASS